MSMTQQNTDVMVLSAAHSLMVSDVPEIVIDAHSLSENFYKGTVNFSEDPKKSLERFGMWGGTLNVNQFMPEVTSEMLKPKDSDFIEPMFRMLSAAIVAKKYNPTEFPEAVLKESMPLLVGQSVNLDHETDVANAIGAVKSVEWQEAYQDEKTGVVIPAGINGIMKIDGLSNPRIARGIQMDPPSIHSNSVTVEFAWEPSHSFEDIWEFYSKLGTYTENGELIRRVVTKIISYKETSLVWHGADPFAQLIKSGKLNSPAYAGSQYYSFSEEKAAEAYTVQAGLRLPGAAFVQLHAVGKAVVPLGELPQGLPAAAAGIKEVGGNTLRELNTPEQQCDIVRVGGVIPQLDIVHKPSDHGGIGGTADWKRTSKAAECVIDRLISR